MLADVALTLGCNAVCMLALSSAAWNAGNLFAGAMHLSFLCLSPTNGLPVGNLHRQPDRSTRITVSASGPSVIQVDRTQVLPAWPVRSIPTRPDGRV